MFAENTKTATVTNNRKHIACGQRSLSNVRRPLEKHHCSRTSACKFCRARLEVNTTIRVNKDVCAGVCVRYNVEMLILFCSDVSLQFRLLQYKKKSNVRKPERFVTFFYNWSNKHLSRFCNVPLIDDFKSQFWTKHDLVFVNGTRCIAVQTRLSLLMGYRQVHYGRVTLRKTTWKPEGHDVSYMHANNMKTVRCAVVAAASSVRPDFSFPYPCL